MISPQELSSRAALCRQLAKREPANGVLWMAEAENWSRQSKEKLHGGARTQMSSGRTWRVCECGRQSTVLILVSVRVRARNRPNAPLACVAVRCAKCIRCGLVPAEAATWRTGGIVIRNTAPQYRSVVDVEGRGRRADGDDQIGWLFGIGGYVGCGLRKKLF